MHRQVIRISKDDVLNVWKLNNHSGANRKIDLTARDSAPSTSNYSSICFPVSSPTSMVTREISSITTKSQPDQFTDPKSEDAGDSSSSCRTSAFESFTKAMQMEVCTSNQVRDGARLVEKILLIAAKPCCRTLCCYGFYLLLPRLRGEVLVDDRTHRIRLDICICRREGICQCGRSIWSQCLDKKRVESIELAIK